jgi:phage terminase large subunit
MVALSVSSLRVCDERTTPKPPRAFQPPAQRIDLGYQARPQFEPFHARKQRWACLVVHRRAGKTVACVMDLVDAALRCKKQDGRFAYLAPTYAQAKDTSWAYLKRFTAGIPNVEQRESDLMVVFPNGARVRLYGAENYERLRGTYQDGLVMDEYGDFDPRAWPEVLRPSLADREGWAVIIGTPKGRNDFWRVHTNATIDPDWYSLLLRASDTGLLPQAELADMRGMMSADQYDQELECSFDAAIRGAIYRTELQAIEAQNRICSVPYDPATPVFTAWDLGIGTGAVWCAQIVGKEVHVIDHYEASGDSLVDYVKWLDSKPYRYAMDLLPHDAGARELGTGKTREELLRANGRKVRVLPPQSIEDGIEAVKMMLGRAWFDRESTTRGRECLAHYRRDFNDKMGIYKDAPLHDWASHSADAMRYLAMGLREHTDQPVALTPRVPVIRLGEHAGASWMGL